MQRVESEVGTYGSTDWQLRRHGHWELIFHFAIFDKQIQLLSQSKAAKAELYLIGGYHNEWIELTYYIGTLHETTSFQSMTNAHIR